VTGQATGTIIEMNTVGGNTNGIYVAAGARDTTIRQNTAVGNPQVQLGGSQPAVRAADIVNLAPEDSVVFHRNQCVTSVGGPCPSNTVLDGRRPPD